ncbi:serine/threonine protein kinase [Streptomyces sp. GMY02]|uniref:serine/threonine-protein kinase n=1 Tax=Streptomyces sp. GMY02 TaxID=1333528 RepID=UPI001C2C28C9|nr:serine/threonine-protein kinase [Streptomyces sp. GMY02]QXE33505.1 serine/threonine protein kinase [Streptomyces sp. GMY02]
MPHNDAASTDETAERLVAGRYRLRSVLGEGGMGTVWRARDEVLHREVAVKEVRAPAGLATEQVQRLYARLEREALSAARISARSVVTVHDVTTHDGRPWIVMEFVRGRSLAEVISSEGALSPQRSARIGAEVLAALRAAYDAGVLHRDVKPANVLLGDDGRVVLTDFGIATLEGDAALTMTGEVIGSPEYLAPERALGRIPTLASDLWSLGALLYTAVQGRSPFRRTTPLATLRAVVDDQLPPPHRAGPLTSVIERLMHKDPAQRMSPDEAERELRAAAADTAEPSARPLAPADGELPTAETSFGETAEGATVGSPTTTAASPVPGNTTDTGDMTTVADIPAAGAPAAPRPAIPESGTVTAVGISNSLGQPTLSGSTTTASATAAAPAPRSPEAGPAAGTARPPVIPAGPAGPAAGTVSTTPASPSDSQPARRRRVGYLIAGAALALALIAGGLVYVLVNGDDGAGTKAGSPLEQGDTAGQPVSVSVKGSSTTYTGSCPANDSSPRFTATFTVTRLPFQFSYRWVSTNGSVIDEEWRTLAFEEGGPRTHEESVQLSTYAESGTLESGMAVEIQSPFETVSNSVPFSVTCVTTVGG